MSVFPPADTFVRRHVGPDGREIEEMLSVLGVSSLDELADQVVPKAIRLSKPMALPPARTEKQALADLAAMAGENEIWRSYLGMGYHDTVTPPVVLRNILENPGWYTAYTPYQAEISQGRLEMLLTFQTMVRDLTAMEVSNASLLDEGTAAAEAMTMAHRLYKGSNDTFFVSDRCHPQTIACVETRAVPLGIQVVVGDAASFDFAATPVFGALVQYPDTAGVAQDWSAFVDKAHAAKALVTFAVDLLSLTMLKAPGEMGADIVVGNSQRFGVPLGYGGPHAAFLATREAYVRQMPGRLIGVSKDADGNVALRMALGTREQHIRREKATSNICTAQVLLANVAAAYAVWHGPEGLRNIARRAHAQAATVREGARRAGFAVGQGAFFDTVRVECGPKQADVLGRAAGKRINLRTDGTAVIVALDETVDDQDVKDLLDVFGCKDALADVAKAADASVGALARTSEYLTHPTFHRYHSETEMLRYLHSLEAKDFSLNTGMIPLGSCTMKLNATTEMIPITWAGFGRMHPFAPKEQAKGYQRLFSDLEAWLCAITGFDAVSLQPNAGSQGEYAGLLAIRGYHAARGDHHRTVCLIPRSAHGTNPASAVMAGMKVVVTACDDAGNVDVADLRAKAEQHKDELAALMVTYPSTHGVFETSIREICQVVHQHGGQVYMDGANMNAQVGLTSPAEIGADVCHLNLHKTFCIPHGGGGPGMGPIGVRRHLAPFLPGHPLETSKTGPVSAAPWGSASILPISWAYIAMMGADGLTMATKVAILNANYVAKRLEGAYPTLYAGSTGRVAHECILECKDLKATAGVEAEDIAKRLMDYGFHAPTLSFPVVGTLMVEPTESENKHELDRFVEAMLQIREEARAIAEGRADRDDNPLKHAPHTADSVVKDEWTHAYPRTQAAFPTSWTKSHKFWPTVRRVDNVYGDRHLVCACVPTDAYSE